MNIYQRINEVRKAIAYIKKDASVQGYTAVTHDAVTALTRDLLISHGIVVVPSLVSTQTVLTGTQTSRGTPFVRMEAVYRFSVVNMDDPADKFDMDIAGHALDQGDKNPGKVLSYCRKYATMKLFELESGDDDEGRAEQHKQAEKSVAADVFSSMTEKQKVAVTDAAMEVIGFLADGEDQQGFECYVTHRDAMDADLQVALWSRFSAPDRKTIKRLGQAWSKAEAARKEKGAA